MKTLTEQKSVSANMRDWKECHEWRLFMNIELFDIASETNFPIEILKEFEAGKLCGAVYYDAIRAAYYHYMVLHSESIDAELPIMEQFIESKGLADAYETFYENRVEELYKQFDEEFEIPQLTLGQEHKYMRMRLGVSVGKLSVVMCIDKEKIEEFEALETITDDSVWKYFGTAYHLALELISEKAQLDYWRVFEELGDEPQLPDNNIMANITKMKNDEWWAVYKYDDNTSKITGFQVFDDLDKADEYLELVEKAVVAEGIQ